MSMFQLNLPLLVIKNNDYKQIITINPLAFLGIVRPDTWADIAERATSQIVNKQPGVNFYINVKY